MKRLIKNPPRDPRPTPTPAPRARARALPLLLAAGAALVPLPASAGEPMEKVKASVSQFLGVLQGPGAKPPGATGADAEARTESLRKVLNGIFDYDQLSRRALGRGWQKLSPPQQVEFKDLFSELLFRTYLNRYESDYKVEIGYLKEVMFNATRAEVQTRVTYASENFAVNYRLYQSGAEWRVYDVTIEGVSMVSNYRSQFNSLLDRGTPQEMIEQLRKKVEKVSAGDAEAD